MDPTVFRALNLRCPPIHLRPRSLIRPAQLEDLKGSKPSPPLKPSKPSILRAAPLPTSLSCSLERGDTDFHAPSIAGAVSEASHDKPLQVVLVSPQIAGNTGCIARTCAASAVGLHLVEVASRTPGPLKLVRKDFSTNTPSPCPFHLIDLLSRTLHTLGVFIQCYFILIYGFYDTYHLRFFFQPLGYKVDDSKLKRAGLDYWPYVVVKIHGSWSEFRDYFMQQNGEKRLLAFTKRGTSIHSDFSYKPGDWLVFGSETCGLPADALLDCSREGIGGGTIRIPMVESYVRCLNLSVSVGIALYEASRQLNYEQLQFSPEAGSGSQRLFLSEDIYG